MYFGFRELLGMATSMLIPILALVVIAKVIGGILGGATNQHGTVSDSYQGWFYVIQQQHVGVIERLGKFHQVVGPGFHARIPFIDRVRDVSLMTEDEHITFDAKTEDNVRTDPRASTRASTRSPIRWRR